jgi:hypothetical protein
MKYIRTTLLESFRRMLYANPDSETQYDTEESFLNTLCGRFTGNDKTAVGTAFHAIVERGESVCDVKRSPGLSEFDPETVRCTVSIEGNRRVAFNGRQMDAALDYRDELRGAFHEVPARKIFPTRYEDIEVSGTADVLHGIYIRDIKTRFSQMKTQDYRDSLQWRMYLSLFEMANFAYDVFEFANYAPEQGINVTGNPLVKHPPIECAGYLTMESDLTALLNEFMEYIRFKNLDEYIMRRRIILEIPF